MLTLRDPTTNDLDVFVKALLRRHDFYPLRLMGKEDRVSRSLADRKTGLCTTYAARGSLCTTSSCPMAIREAARTRATGLKAHDTGCTVQEAFGILGGLWSCKSNQGEGMYDAFLQF